MVATCITAAGATLAVPTAGYALCSLKNNYQNLIIKILFTLLK